MKKLCSLFLIVLLVLTGVMAVQAAGGAMLSGDDSVVAGNALELTVSVSDCPDVSSASVDVSFGDSFELVSAQWLKTGAIAHYDTEKNKGVIGGLDSPDINGELFKLVLKAKTPSAEAQTVSVTVAAKNGAEDVIKETAQKSITVVCASHTYDEWSMASNGQRQSICSVCGQKGELIPTQPDETEDSAEAPVDSETVPTTETEETADVTEPEPADGQGNGFFLWLMIGAAVVALAAAVLIAVKKKK